MLNLAFLLPQRNCTICCLMQSRSAAGKGFQVVAAVGCKYKTLLLPNPLSLCENFAFCVTDIVGSTSQSLFQ